MPVVKDCAILGATREVNVTLDFVTVIGLLLLWREQLRGGLLPKQEESREKTVA